MTESASSPPRPQRLAGHVLVEALIAQGIDTVFGVPNDTEYQLVLTRRMPV
jgi:acetolactate synthase-1/2/3 large subunit